MEEMEEGVIDDGICVVAEYIIQFWKYIPKETKNYNYDSFIDSIIQSVNEIIAST